MTTSSHQTRSLLMQAYEALSSGKTFVCTDKAEQAVLKRFGFLVDEDLVSLDEEIELLNEDEISTHLVDELNGIVHRIEILPCIDSTNDLLEARSKEMSIDGHVVMAEVQTAGRGRRGRKWETPFGKTIALSLGVSIDMPASSVSCLSLVVGVAVADALKSVGVVGAELKWPNDVLIDGGKAGGILTELVLATRPVEVVIGIGINVGSASCVREFVDYPVADICDHVGTPLRNRLIAELINHVLRQCKLFEKNGFAALRDRWMKLDAFRNQNVLVSSPTERLVGKAVGLGPNGELLIQTEQGSRRKIIGGDVSLREIR